MGFSTALSGLNAASSALAVTGNNIANSQTTGFKESRAQFGDVYVSSLGSAGNTAIGTGVSVASVAQQFKQGNIESTANSLDLAISGNGFFSMGSQFDPTVPNNPLEATSFTRNGSFHLNNAGNVVDDNGSYLLAFAPVGTTVAEGFNVGVKTPVLIKTDQGSPTATKNVTMDVNLNGAAPIATVPFAFTTDVPPIPNPATYDHTTSITTYDSLGNAHIVSTYFSKTLNPNEWNVFTFVDGKGVDASSPSNTTTNEQAGVTTPTTIHVVGEPPIPTVITFDSKGNLYTGQGGAPVGVTGQDPTTHSATSVDFGVIDVNALMQAYDSTGAPITPVKTDVKPLSITIDFAGSTQFATPFTVNNLKQDGLPVGNLTGVDVDTKGIIFAKYSNGYAKPIGQVALARFPDPQALSKVAGTTWQATADSGAPIYGAGTDNNFGAIKSSAIENSNVDLSAELVKLIVAQQAYQANAQTITSQKSLVETILRA